MNALRAALFITAMVCGGATNVIAQVVAANPATGPTVVVVGERLPALQRALAACIARHCPPDEEIAAALKVAENQFVSGDYRDARGTLAKSIGRNKRFARNYPVPVSDILRANYRIAAHLGDGETFRIGTFDTVSALKAGLPGDDPRVLAAEIEVGDMFARFNRIDEASDQYDRVRRHAAALGLYNVEGMAQLRIVGLYAQLAAVLPFQYKAEAKKAAAVLIESPDPHLRPFGQGARVLMARLDAKGGDAAAVDRLIADFRSMGSGNTPILLFAPPIKTAINDRDQTSGENLDKLSRTNYDGEWVDIGFWVTPDGRVDDADVLRTGKGAETPDWVKPVLAAIRGRRYAPLAMDAAQPGVLRVERYTLTARLTTNTGSRLVVRQQQQQIEMLDLTAEPAGNSASR